MCQKTLFFFLFWCSTIIAQTPFNSSVSGNWTAGTTWVGGVAPSLTGGANNLSGSNVTIGAGHSVTLTSSMTVKSTSTITINGTLTIDGLLDFENGCTILINPGGELICNNAVNSNNSTDITINGTFTVNGDLNLGAGSDMSGSGSVAVSGTSSGSGTVFGSAFICDDCEIASDGTITDNLTIIDGSNINHSVPIEPNYNYTYSQQIYYQNDINLEGNIEEVAFKYNGYNIGGYAFTDNVEIYMGNVLKNEFSDHSDWVDISQLTLVYDGPYSVGSTEDWYSVVLDNPFYYDNVSHLLVAVYEKSSGSHYWSSGEFLTGSASYQYGTIVGDWRVLTYFNDGSVPNLVSPQNANWNSIQAHAPALQLRIQETNGSLLPVELLNFQVICNENEKLISWETASEINAAYFQIDKSFDGHHWHKLVEIGAIGNSSNRTSYKFVDKNDNESYYRLSQYDYDGKREEFGPIYGNCNSKPINLTLSPNPANDITHIVVSNAQNGVGKIEIQNLRGQLVFSQKINFSDPSFTYSININHLEKGAYFLNVTTPDNLFLSNKLIKN